MIAEIRHIDHQHQAVFGFAESALSPDLEMTWYASLQKACDPSRPGRSCDIGGHELLEVGFLDRQKLTAMGAADSTKTGIWIGFHVADAGTLDRVVKGEIRNFTLDFDPHQGIEVRFEAPQPTRQAFAATAGINKREEIMCDNNRLPATVTKCLNSTPERLSKQDFDTAISDLAKTIQQEGETFEGAYVRVLQHEVGKRLYEGYDLAPYVPSPFVSKQAEQPVSKAWDRIETAAATIRRNEPSLTKEQSVAQALREQPELYASYLDEVEAQAV